MYIACGQDPAHVVEGSNAITSAEMDGDGLHFSVSFPSLPLGTVGGGTGLATQSECLNLLGVRGGGNPPGLERQEAGRDRGVRGPGRRAVPAGSAGLPGPGEGAREVRALTCN